MLNTIILLGRLTKEPELRKTNSDISVANFDLAVDNSFLDADGERGTTFISVRCFRDTADNVCKHLHKGSKVAITGSLYQRNFIRKDGSKGSVHEINADSVEFLDPKPVNEVQEAEQAEAEIAEEPSKPEPKFDPMTGKPLKPNTKK